VEHLGGRTPMAREDLEDKFMLEAHLVKTTLCNPQQMRVIETAHPTLIRFHLSS